MNSEQMDSMNTDFDSQLSKKPLVNDRICTPSLGKDTFVLPYGPAPPKPPRTFKHVYKTNLSKKGHLIPADDTRTKSSQKSDAEASDNDSSQVSTLNPSGDDSQDFDSKQNPAKDIRHVGTPEYQYAVSDNFKGDLLNMSRVHQPQTVASKPPVMHSSEEMSRTANSEQPQNVVRRVSLYEEFSSSNPNTTTSQIPSVSEAQQNGLNPLQIKQPDVPTFPSASNNPQILSHVASQHVNQTPQIVPQPSFNASVSPPIASLEPNVPQPKPRNNKGHLI